MRALGKAVRQGFLPTCERSYRDFWLPMLDYNTPAYNNKTKEMPFEREPSVFFYSLPSVEHELLAPARQDTQPLPQLGSDGEEDDSDSDESATKKMRLMAQSTLPYTSRESDVDEKEEEDEREETAEDVDEEEEDENDKESDKEEGKEEDKEEVETDKEDEEEEEEEGNENSTEEEKKQDEKQEDKDKEEK